MKKVRESKDVKGITLLALVITIIILLILAGIAINLSFGEGGVLSETKEAVNAWTKGEEDEKSELSKLGNEMKEIRKEYTPPKVEELKKGDYVKYKAGNNGEKGEIMCKVLYTADSKYGLQIAAISSVEDVTLGVNTSVWSEARDAYNNAIKTLNSKAEEYINPIYTENGENGVKGARCLGSSIKMEDKNKEETTETVVLPASSWTSYTRPSGWESDDTGCIVAGAGVSVGNEFREVVEELNKNIWVPFRSFSNYSTFCGFNICYAFREESASGGGGAQLCYVNNIGTLVRGYAVTNGFIPVISVKSNVKLTRGDGITKETAYELGI